MKQVAQQSTETILYTAQGTQVHIETDDGIYQHYNAKAAGILGILQIVLGILIIISQIVVIVAKGGPIIGDYFDEGYHGAYVGIWTSVIFILAGIFGLISAKYKSRCTVIVTMVLSIIAAVFTIGAIAEGGMGAAFNPHYADELTTEDRVAVAFNFSMVTLGLTEAIVAIVAAVYCCLGSFCHSKPRLVFTIPGLIPLNTAVPYQPLHDERDLSATAYYSGTTFPPQYVEKV